MNEQHLQVAITAAKAGAAELMSRRDDRVVREKAPKDLVTDADLASQQAIRSHSVGGVRGLRLCRRRRRRE